MSADKPMDLLDVLLAFKKAIGDLSKKDGAASEALTAIIKTQQEQAAQIKELRAHVDIIVRLLGNHMAPGVGPK